LKEDDDRVLGSVNKQRWCYSSSKAACEHFIQAHHAHSGLRFVIFRFFNAYGPRLDELGSGRVIPKMLLRAFRGDDLLVYGTGSQTRCFTYVDDVIDGVVQASFAASCEGQTLNIGSDRETSILELARTLIQVGRFRSKIKLVPYKDAFNPNYEDIERRVPALERIFRLTGWQASTSLEEGLRITISSYVDESGSREANQGRVFHEPPAL
jgi:UDP-glucose 4-epimerase